MNVAVIFGGKSCEHNVSIVTGLMALGDFPPEYNAIPVYIDESGVWRTGKEYFNYDTYSSSKRRLGGKEVHFVPDSQWLYGRGGKKISKIDCCLICNHGANGEDGSLQGLLQMYGIPYTGSDVCASAVGMNKSVMKKLFAAESIPTVKSITVKNSDYTGDSFGCIEQIKSELRFPVIVKPNRAGSSIGIGIAHGYDELFAALRQAFEWDNEAIVENALNDFEEYNCAVTCGEASEVEKPVGWKEFLTYEDKYLSKSSEVGREFPAKIPPELTKQIREYAVKAYNAVGADGIARVDFLYCDGELYVNEINTVPGSLSAYFYKEGTAHVIRKLVKRAVEAYRERGRLKYKFNKYVSNGAKK